MNEEYIRRISAIHLSRWDEFDYKRDVHKIFEIVEEVIESEIEALGESDYSRASGCNLVYSLAYSKFDEKDGWEKASKGRLKNLINERLGETHKRTLAQKIQEYGMLTAESSFDEIKSKLTEFSTLSGICTTQMANEERQKTRKILVNVVEDKIAQLDAQLQEAKKSKEFPGNNRNIEELQSQIEQLEELTGLPSKHRDARIAEEQAKEREEREAIEKAEQEAKAKAEQEAREAQARAEQEAIEKEQEKLPEESQPEKIRPEEESIKDKVGDDLKNRGEQLPQPRTEQRDLWMARANRWYGDSSLAGKSLELSAKFTKMKSDIVQAIREEAVIQKGDNTQSQATDGRGVGI